jgi:hypothetical protein
MSFRELFASIILRNVFAGSRCIHAVMPDESAGLECPHGGRRSAKAVSRFGGGTERDGHGFMALDANPRTDDAVVRASLSPVVSMRRPGAMARAKADAPPLIWNDRSRGGGCGSADAGDRRSCRDG